MSTLHGHEAEAKQKRCRYRILYPDRRKMWKENRRLFWSLVRERKTGIKEHGGLNAWEWVRANLVIRNLPLFTEKEIEIPNNNNGVTDVQTSFNIIWEYIGKDKIPTSVTSIEELQATIEQLQSENQKLKENLSISNGKFEKILARSEEHTLNSSHL